ncbi:MAG TPA: glycosyltransferase [Acidimicrobiales bacterium]|nr:glycosyltransferase [Acidimicrobiales bacterium]
MTDGRSLKPSLKIAIVSEHASPLAVLGGADAGGQNVHVGALAAELVAQGHSVTVHTRRDDPALPRTVVTDGGVVVEHVDAGPPEPVPKDDLRVWMEDFATVLGERWAAARPDVAHAHFWMSGLATLLAAPRLGIPVVQTFHALGTVKRRHQGDADTSPPDRIDTERRLLAESDHIIATCQDEVAELERMGGPGGGVSTIPCGVDLGLFRPEGPALPRRSRRRAAVIGRLVPRKGVADAIEALRWLPDTELVIAGGPAPEDLDDDAEVARLRAVAQRAGVTAQVVFMGRLSRLEVPALLRSADAVVSVPYYEPFGIVPVEAMACGTPPVVTAVGGMRESVVDGETGLHVPAGDPKGLAAALRHLFDHPLVARRISAGAVRRARTTFGWPQVASRTAAVYTQVARGAKPTLLTGTGRP